MKTTKSPRRLLIVAHLTGRLCLPDYSHRFSPKKFTQPQLFACLVLKEFLGAEKGTFYFFLTSEGFLVRVIVMPRTARAAVGGLCYHVLNRGNGRAEVFHKPADYDAFLELFAPACERLHMRVLGWCLMPNHFHLVLRPFDDGDLGRWMGRKRGHSTFS